MALDNFPLNVNGKTDRKALKVQFDSSKSQHNDVELRALVSELSGHYQNNYDALRVSFAQILHVPLKHPDRSSSFIALGGHLLAAIRLSNFLKQHGHFLVAVQVLRLDTIGRLEEVINHNQKMQHEEASNGELEVGFAPATDVQKLFLRRSLHVSAFCALIGVATYVGDAHGMPTTGELHKALITASSAHQIFQTRFDLTHLAIRDLGRLNLDWCEVSVSSTAEFEATCTYHEERAWHDLGKTTTANVEIPYCKTTCISVPDRKAIALVTRIHHILIDVFSAAMFWQDVKRALAGEHVPRGPQILDFVRFMQAYKRDNLDRIRVKYEAMLENFPATAVLQPPTASTVQQDQATQLGLIRFDSPTTVTENMLDQAARSHRVTTTTLVCAAWSLFLNRITTWDRVGFSVSVSGRTVP